MSAYDNDPRVRRAGDFRYDVGHNTANKPDWFVRWNHRGVWAVISYVGGTDITDTFPAADEAIRSLIGEPR